MNGSLYVGATGMRSLAEGMNVVSNNIANANTLGFKQQSMLFGDLMYQGQGGMGNSWGAQDGSYVAMGQVGMGVQIDSVRTLFTQGSYEMGNEVTDMSITGKGFFEVTNMEGQKRYTRAGNFRFNNEGFLNLPDGSTLSGYALDEKGNKTGAAGPIRVDPFAASAAKATSKVSLDLDLGLKSNNSVDEDDPYFSLLKAFDSQGTPPLAKGKYGYSQDFRINDATGATEDLSIYFDGAPSTTAGGGKTLEFVVSKNAVAPDAGGQALMSGTLTFNAAGQLVDMSAFVPNGGDPKDLNNWVPATLNTEAGGVPQFTYNGQTIALDLGLTAPNGWANAPASAAAVGKAGQQLASMGQGAVRDKNATMGYGENNTQRSVSQDGYAEGKLSRMEIDESGKVVATFSNGQTQALYEIPVCRFTSEDGLRREGGNYFSKTDAAGTMEMGQAGQENYGKIQANSLESSNVDMAREMVNMITTQRGFQSNSKVVTTADAMLQKAIELKR